jgi:hypothetical protein
MKKFLFLVILALVAVGVLYKLDMKPEVKDVVKEVKINNDTPATATPAPENKTNAVPTQNVPTQ